MLFQSFYFLVFFIMVTVMLFTTKGKLQRFILLCANLFFYAYGSPAHLPLFLGVILFTYGYARILEWCPKKAVLAAGIVLTFVPLFVCKYVPFLMSQFSPLTDNFFTHIALPVGISFYTFQAVGYLVDVYRGKFEAEHDLLVYALFISFFPITFAGPIERAGSLIGQLRKDHKFEYDNVAAGLTTMAVGLLLKVFIADRLATVVNAAYDNISAASGLVLLMATFLFGLQIYCDFNGYSTIARGAAKVLGVQVTDNFKRPYFSTSCTEFWRRWHISLSTWFRDYLYFPLGGSRCSKLRSSFNLMVTFLVSGIWHGANWTFVIWGGLNGIYQVVEKLFKIHGKKAEKSSDTRKNEGLRVKLSGFMGFVITYILINFSWLFFRANRLSDAFEILRKIFVSIPGEIGGLVSGTVGIGEIIALKGSYLWNLGMSLIGITVLVCYSLYKENKGFKLLRFAYRKAVIRYAIYFLILFITLCFGKFGSESQFIYFRF